MYYDSLDSIVNYFEEVTGKRFESTDEIEKYLQEALEAYSDGGASISVHEFAYE